MEFIFELLFEIIVEGSLELGTHRKVPMPLRVLALGVFGFVYGGLMFLLFVSGIDAYKEGNLVAAVFFIAVSVGLLVGCIYMTRKKFKENAEKKEDK